MEVKKGKKKFKDLGTYCLTAFYKDNINLQSHCDV